MDEDVAAEHNTTTETIPIMDQLVREVLKVFRIKLPVKTQTSTLTAGDYNMTNQFTFDKHENLYTSSINYSYLSFPMNHVTAPKVTEIGWNYSISTYTSHQTQLDYNLTNFFHIGGTQHFLYQVFLRNTFQVQSGNEPPSVQGYYKQFWELYSDSGPDPFTPIFACLLVPLAFYLIVPMFAYQMSQEKGDGLLSLQQMMGLHYFPRFFADLVYQLCISMVLFAVIIGGLAIAGMEFITQTYWPIWLLSCLLFVLNIPVLS